MNNYLLIMAKHGLTKAIDGLNAKLLSEQDLITHLFSMFDLSDDEIKQYIRDVSMYGYVYFDKTTTTGIKVCVKIMSEKYLKTTI